MAKKEQFTPAWRETPPRPRSYRSIFKWGDPQGFKHPNKRLYRLMKDEFGLSDRDFSKPLNEGDEQVVLTDKPVLLKQSHIDHFKKISGDENVTVDDYERLKFSYGKTAEEAWELREKVVREVSDAVVHPRNKQEVAAIIEYCDKNGIPVYVFGGGSSVNFGVRPAMGGITLVLQTHMNQVVSINETNKTCLVQAGMMGPDFENALNKAQKNFGTEHNYTNGHFPQSFEYSTVGGWIVTWASGQQSSYFGDAADLAIAMEWVTPAGHFKTLEYPAAATGPKVNDIMKGSEGTFGVLVEATVKIFYHMPKNQFGFSFIFPTWEKGLAAVKKISQGEFGFPGVMRLSDAEETEVGLKLYGVEGTILDTLMNMRGFKPMQRALFLGRTEGERGFSKHVLKQCKKICREYGGMSLTGFAVKSWEHGRYRDPYLKEDMMDYGITIDTLETSVTWENLPQVHEQVRAFVKSRPRTLCMAHASHFYPQGTNLYFIFNAKFKDTQEYVDFQTGVIDAIAKSGGSLSHHHGVGRMIAPWLEEHLGIEQLEVLRVLKQHFDPNGIMNPGGQMGLDYRAGELPDRQWRIDWKAWARRKGRQFPWEQST